jgi:glycosyltransferase involved in cell wall biosynthesis
MDPAMKISVITVSYNSAKTIEDTILSVVKQTYSNIEYIVIDGGSTDGTLDICEKYREKIRHLVSEKDKGIYDAMNKGLALASGEVIGILNSDDLYADDNVIAKVADKISSTGADALYADLVYVDPVNTNKIKRYWHSGNFQRKKFKWGWMPPHPTVFIRKEIYQQFGNFNLDLRSAADYELMLRFFYKQGVTPVYLPKIITRMRTGGESNVTVNNRIKANREDKKAWEINGLKPLLFTFFLKPLRKIPQFIFTKPKNGT